MNSQIRDKEFNSNPGDRVRQDDVCALLYNSGVYKDTDKNGWSINSDVMEFLNQYGMKVDVTIKKSRLKLRGGHQQQRVKVWIITVVEKSLAHPSSIGSDFKKCIQIMREIFPSYKSELNAISYRKNSAHDKTTKRKQNDMMVKLNVN